jgi:hypothetical protein
MILKRTGIALAAMTLTLLASPDSALAGPNDNNNAGVGGVAGVSADQGCPLGNFCIYTQPNYGGTVYRLYHCREYDLYNWNGNLSWYNNNVDGAHALIQDRNYRTLIDTAPNTTLLDVTYDFNQDFRPVWHIKAC